MEPGSTDHCPRMAPTPGCSFVARVAFTYGDREFAAGDPFPYGELDMTENAAWNFWRSAMLEVAQPAPWQEPVPERPPAPPPEPAPEPAPEPEPQPEAPVGPPRRYPGPATQRSSKR